MRNWRLRNQGRQIHRLLPKGVQEHNIHNSSKFPFVFMSITPIYQNFLLTKSPVKAGYADNRLKASDRRILLELSRDGHQCRRFQTTGHVRAGVARADRFGDRDDGRLCVTSASAAGDGPTIAGKSGWSRPSQVRSRRINDLTCEKRLATAFVVHGKDGLGMGRAARREGRGLGVHGPADRQSCRPAGWNQTRSGANDGRWCSAGPQQPSFPPCSCPVI